MSYCSCYHCRRARLSTNVVAALREFARLVRKGIAAAGPKPLPVRSVVPPAHQQFDPPRYAEWAPGKGPGLPTWLIQIEGAGQRVAPPLFVPFSCGGVR